MDDLEQHEREKYREAWNLVNYRTISPGEQFFVPWLKIVRPLPRSMVHDFGCGAGRASLVMALAGFYVTPIDFAENCLDPEAYDVVGSRFVNACLWNPIPVPKAPYGFCCDVMEHIPPEKVDDVIRNILDRCWEATFLISFEQDHFGDELGERLHLTVQPFGWWLETLRGHGNVIDARDLVHEGMFRVVAKPH